jgi:hypothetical protein
MDNVQIKTFASGVGSATIDKPETFGSVNATGRKAFKSPLK